MGDRVTWCVCGIRSAARFLKIEAKGVTKVFARKKYRDQKLLAHLLPILKNRDASANS